MARVIVAYGTRPEQIKLRPVMDALTAEGFSVVHWWSGQSRDLVHGQLPVDFHPISWADLSTGIAGVLREFPRVLEQVQPDAVLVQGDTATAFAVALSSFLARVPIGHVEAGLRTYQAEPWPEEAFRRMIAPMARWHFCPDYRAAENVACESGHGYGTGWTGLAGCVDVGNTIVDTLPIRPFRVLVTLHRRENQGKRIRDALTELSKLGLPIEVIKHPNWSAWNMEAPEVAFPALHWTEPMSHEELIGQLGSGWWAAVVTDSGGLQEEAAHFGIPCLVFRTSTERVALVRSGAVKLSPPDDPHQILAWLETLYEQCHAYGDGSAGARIARILKEELCPTTQTTSTEPTVRTTTPDYFHPHGIQTDHEILGEAPI